MWEEYMGEHQTGKEDSTKSRTRGETWSGVSFFWTFYMKMTLLAGELSLFSSWSRVVKVERFIATIVVQNQFEAIFKFIYFNMFEHERYVGTKDRCRFFTYENWKKIYRWSILVRCELITIWFDFYWFLAGFCWFNQMIRGYGKKKNCPLKYIYIFFNSAVVPYIYLYFATDWFLCVYGNVETI